jgi:hypothetical protein
VASRRFAPSSTAAAGYRSHLGKGEGRPRKQRHTARRIFERLKAEHGFTGGETIVKDYIREQRLRGQEMFVPLVHPPGHGQADFGEAIAVIGGVELRNCSAVDSTVPDNRELGVTPLRWLIGRKSADPARLCDPVMQPW